MGSIKLLVFSLILILNLGCQLGYLAKSSYDQMALLNSRIDVARADQDPELSPDQKRKIELAQKVRVFSQERLKLKETKNYSSYVKLNRPYVTYVVSAAQKWKLEKHEWYFPFVGHVPYKGFFKETDAQEEEKSLQGKNLDTSLRGVSAYSTLGWFNDPLLSSMLRGKDHDLVNTLIHETVHATLYIKSSADFNERMAVFLGNKGTEIFYLEFEGPESQTLKTIRDENEDEKKFSEFISQEMKQLEDWYAKLPAQDEALREKKFKEIKDHFEINLKPNLKTKNFDPFPNSKINNASLLLYRTYVQDLADFETLFQKSKNNFETFLNHCKSLEKSSEPERALKDLIAKLPAI